MAVSIIIAGIIIAYAIRPEWMEVAPGAITAASMVGMAWAVVHDILMYAAAKDRK